MLYTVVPIENVYRNSEKTKDIVEEKGMDKYKEIKIKHGRVMARVDGDQYIVDRVISTDMEDYLNDEYLPGAVIPTTTKFDAKC